MNERAKKSVVDPAVYIAVYCNKSHRTRDGKPVSHECYILPPAALSAERDGRFDEAISLIESAKPLRLMKRGTRE